MSDSLYDKSLKFENSSVEKINISYDKLPNITQLGFVILHIMDSMNSESQVDRKVKLPYTIFSENGNTGKVEFNNLIKYQRIIKKYMDNEGYINDVYEKIKFDNLARHKRYIDFIEDKYEDIVSELCIKNQYNPNILTEKLKLIRKEADNIFDKLIDKLLKTIKRDINLQDIFKEDKEWSVKLILVKALVVH